MSVGIYMITSPVDKIYIGQSTNIEKRWDDYKSLSCKRQIKLYNSLVKHGVANHVFSILQECEAQQLNALEMDYICTFNTFNSGHGLNLKNGGGANSRHSAETIKKMSASHKNRSPETNKKISEGLKRAHRETTWPEGVKGRRHTKETRLKMSLSKTGKLVAEDVKRKMSQSALDRGISDATKVKMAEARKKIILNTLTGIFYFGVSDAAESCSIKPKTLHQKLKGDRKNNTAFAYV